jgi:hypothetical protein
VQTLKSKKTKRLNLSQHRESTVELGSNVMKGSVYCYRQVVVTGEYNTVVKLIGSAEYLTL